MHLTAKKFLFVPILAGSLLFGGCHTTSAHGPLGTRVDETLLQYASTSDRAKVADAQHAHDAMHQELLTAQREVSDAKGKLAVADESLTVAKAEFDRARVAAEVDASGKGAEDVRARRQAVRDAEAEVLARKLDIDVAEHKVEVAQQKCDLALAKVDLAAAEAVAATERKDAQKVVVADFERAVRAEEADVKVAEVRLEQAQRDAEAGMEARQQRNRELAERDEQRAGG